MSKPMRSFFGGRNFISPTSPARQSISSAGALWFLCHPSAVPDVQPPLSNRSSLAALQHASTGKNGAFHNKEYYQLLLKYEYLLKPRTDFIICAIFSRC
jgi:hypothetical protein